MRSRRSGRRRPADLILHTRRAALVAPPVSTQVFIETDRGTIQVELAVLDAPLTVETFVHAGAEGVFDGLTFHRVVPDFVIQGGDPRGDGEGGPGFTIRDELSQRPYLRGMVGMALDWEDTGGSQFFITHSPQPHLDARYTVIGRVLVGHGGRRSDSAVGCDAARAGVGRRAVTTRAWTLFRRGQKVEKGATAAPLFLTGEVSLPLLAGLLLPALGFLRHCLLSPPSCGFHLRERSRLQCGCRLARSPVDRHSSLRGTFRSTSRLREPVQLRDRCERARSSDLNLTRAGLSSPPSYQM